MVQSAPTGERARRRRLEILRAAAAVFREKGYHAAGMREIAEGLGLAPGALYYYVRSKEELLRACQEESLDRLTAAAERIAAGTRPAAERLRDLVRQHLELTLDVMGGTAAHVEFRALPPGPLAAVVARRDRYERLVRRIVEAGVRDGSFRAVDPKMAALALLGALNWAVAWWRPEGGWSAARLADGFADVFLDGLRRREDREEARG